MPWNAQSLVQTVLSRMEEEIDTRFYYMSEENKEEVREVVKVCIGALLGHLSVHMFEE